MAQIPVPRGEEKQPRRTRWRSPGDGRRFDPNGSASRGTPWRRSRLGRYALGAGEPCRVRPSSCRLRSSCGPWPRSSCSLIGTWQPPMPLHLFSPGASILALQPPRPAQSLLPAQVWALAEAHSPGAGASVLAAFAFALAGVEAAADVRLLRHQWLLRVFLAALSARPRLGAGQHTAEGGRGQLSE